MSRLGTLVALDFRLAVRHRLLAVVVLVAVVFGLLIRFAIPEHVDGAEANAATEIWAHLEHAIEADAKTLGATVETHVLEPGLSKPSLRDRMLPLMFTVDVCMLGFLFAAVMVMQEKETGTIAFLRTTATTPTEYLLSKTLVNLALVGINVGLLVGIAGPGYLLEPGMLAAVFFGAATMTFVGLGLSTLFRNLSSFFYPMAIVGLLAATPMYPYLTPGVEIPGVEWLPTYDVLFGSHAAMFGRPFGSSLFVLAVWVLSMGAWATWLIRRRLFEGDGR